jgi:hypothetical protein
MRLDGLLCAWARMPRLFCRTLIALGLLTLAGWRSPPGRAAATCLKPDPAWLWCDDFEQDRLRSYFEVRTAPNGFERVSGVGRDSSWGMRARFQRGAVNVGALRLALGRTPQRYFAPADSGLATHRELWWRFWLRMAPGWVGGGEKLTRVTVFTSDTTWAQAAIAHVWSGGPGGAHLILDPASGTDVAGRVLTRRYNDFERLRWLGASRSVDALLAPERIGHWLCLEVHVRLNDPGVANGMFELWADGAVQAALRNLNWVGRYQGYGWNAVFLESYWNEGSPATQERYFDDFVVATAPIGCG